MKISFADQIQPKTGAVIAFMPEDGDLSGFAADVDGQAGGSIRRAIDANSFTGKKGSSIEVLAPAGTDYDRFVLIGTGKESELTEPDRVAIGAAVYKAVAMSGSTNGTVCMDASTVSAVDMAEGALLKSYRFDKYRTKEPDSKKPKLKELTFAGTSADDSSQFAAREKVVDGVTFTKNLVSEPGNILYPESFVDEIRTLNRLGVEIDVLGEAEMEELGMGSLLSVGQGSARESQLAIMKWMGADDKDAQPISFVGKGVTFDTGGISLKPGEGMEQMKWDMGGAGTVVGLMKALAGRKAKVNVIGIVGLVENMPSSTATRPGDVVESMSGQTIEILNTDAEGRLVLADAIWYCQETYKPEFIIDLATLTGAMIISLGHEYAGIFSDSDGLSDKLYKAGQDTGDKVWRMPIHENYDKMINTPTADVKNLSGRAAGSITAAQFLKRFTNDVPWVHIDIAGTVWSDKDLPLSDKGGTGFGVRLLDRFVADNYE